MSPRDKAAQLVWPQVFGDYTPTSSSSWARVEQLIGENHVGGFIMSIGSPIETAEKINAMQRLSALPLVFGADYETGVAFRQRGGYFLPNNIYLGGGTMFPPGYRTTGTFSSRTSSRTSFRKPISSAVGWSFS
jgi:beta-N-acetylhexosaminidase